MKRAVPWILGVVILTAVLAVGLTQAGGESEPSARAPAYDLQAALRELEGAPPPLAALHDRSARLLDGGVPAFERRLADLKGHPVVINKWASWCNPCREEFPSFQRLATERGREVAFLGVNAGDSTQPARDFLAEFPLPFPSYLDPHERIAHAIKAPANYPITVFVDAQGETAYIKQGPYRTEAELSADIDRYLGGA